MDRETDPSFPPIDIDAVIPNEYDVPSITPTGQEPVTGGIADLLYGTRGFLDKAKVPEPVPLIGGMGAGELLVGESPEEVEDISYGNLPFFIPATNREALGLSVRPIDYLPQLKQDRKQSFADLLFLGLDSIGIGSILTDLGVAGGKKAVQQIPENIRKDIEDKVVGVAVDLVNQGSKPIPITGDPLTDATIQARETVNAFLGIPTPTAPIKKDIFIGKTAKNWDNDSVKTFEQAEREILAQNPNISYYDLNKQSWERTAQMVKNGELKYPTFRGYDGKLRQEIGDKKSVIINQDFRVVRGANDPVSKNDLQNMLFGSSESGLNPEFEKMLLAEGATLEKVKRDVASLKGMFEDKKDELDPYVATKVAHVIDHPELFDNYSDLMDFILTQEFDKGTRGYFRASRIGEDGKINVSPIESDPRTQELFGDFNQEVIADEFRSTLLHEIQHYIQKKHGFARGAGTNQESKTVILDGLSNIRRSIQGRREGTIALNKNSEKIFNKPLSEIPIQDEIAYMQELGRQARVAERMFYLDDVIENLEKGYRIQPRLFDDILKTYNYIDSSNPVSIKVDKVDYGDLAKRQTVQKIPEAEKTYYGRRYRQRNYDLRTQHNLDTLRNLKEMLLGKGETKPLENYGAIYEEPPVSQKNQKAIYFKNRTEAKNAIQRVNNYGKRPELAAYNSLDTIEKEIIKVTDEVKKQNKLDSNFYYRTLGELEPRLVQSRRNLTATERLNEFPLDTARLVQDPILSPSGKKYRYDSGEVYADYTKLYKDIPTRSFEESLLSKQYTPRFEEGLGSDEDITAFLRANLAPKIFKGFEKLKYERDPYGSDVDVQPFLGRKPDEDIEMRSAKLSEDDFLNLASSGQLRQFRDDRESLESLFTDPNVKAQNIKISPSFIYNDNELEKKLALDYESGDLEKRLNDAGFSYKDDGDGSLIVGRTKKDVDFLEKALDRKKKVGFQYALGKMYGYSEADIAAFYKKRYSDAGLQGSEYFIRDKKEFEKQYKDPDEDIEMRSALPPSDPEPRPVEKNELGLSSKLLETTKGLKQRKGTAAQLLGQLKKTLGKENKEIKDSGIEEFLADKKKINVDEVEEFIKKNQPKFVERVGKEGGEQDTRMQFERSKGVVLTPEEGYGAEYIDKLAKEIIENDDGKPNREEAFALARQDYMNDPIKKYIDSNTGYTIVGNTGRFSAYGNYKGGYKIFKSEADINKKNQFLASDGKPYGDLPNGDVSKERALQFSLTRENDFPTIPEIDNLNEAKVQARAFAEQRGDIDPVAEGVRWADYTETGGTNYQELRLALDEDETLFNEGTHFPDDKNNIFHVRTTDRVYDGTQDESMPKPRKVLYVEELQSDWAQRGRKKGFKLTAKEQEPIIKDFVKNTAEQEKLLYEMIEETGKEKARLKEAGRVMNPEINTKALDEFFDKEADQYFSEDLHRETLLGSDTIEKLFPLTSSGKKISRRELVKKAVEMVKRKFESESILLPHPTNYKEDSPLLYSISSNSTLSIEISNIAKFIRDEIASRKAGLPGDLPSSVRFAPVFEKTELIDKLNKKNVEAYDKLTSTFPKAPFVTDTDSWTQLGIKKLLTKAVDEGYDYVSFSPGHVQYKRWGEEGLKEYYDEIIPKNAKKVVDKIDKEAIVKLDGNRFKKEEDGEGLDADESVTNLFYDSEELLDRYGAILPRFSIKITPKLKEKILKEGLPLYKKGGEVSKGTATIIELMKR